jgi:hypothetical protein
LENFPLGLIIMDSLSPKASDPPARSRPWLRGGIVAFIGYILSPLSWWNDAVVNLPLAYAFGFLVGLFQKELFLPATIFGYWLTNVAGFILMHHGISDALRHDQSPYTKKNLTKYLFISLAYTALILCLIRTGWMRFPLEYFKGR